LRESIPSILRARQATKPKLDIKQVPAVKKSRPAVKRTDTQPTPIDRQRQLEYDRQQRMKKRQEERVREEKLQAEKDAEIERQHEQYLEKQRAKSQSSAPSPSKGKRR